MRIVIDTNVLVAGVLSAAGPPGWIVEAILTGDLELCCNAAIRDEYEDVLHRPELSLSRSRVNALLEAIDRFGVEVTVPPWQHALPDPDDAAFLAVAAWTGSTLVTGNTRHYPARARGNVVVLTPRAFVDWLGQTSS